MLASILYRPALITDKCVGIKFKDGGSLLFRRRVFCVGLQKSTRGYYRKQKLEDFAILAQNREKDFANRSEKHRIFVSL